MRSLLQGANASVQVKICGLRTHEHLQAAIGAGADMLGFIFYAPSHRYIQPQQVQVLLEHTGFTVKDEQQLLPDLVGVFVNENATLSMRSPSRLGYTSSSYTAMKHRSSARVSNARLSKHCSYTATRTGRWSKPIVKSPGVSCSTRQLPYGAAQV